LVAKRVMVSEKVNVEINFASDYAVMLELYYR